MRKLEAAILLSLVVLPCTAARRTTLLLDGNWDIAESKTTKICARVSIGN